MAAAILERALAWNRAEGIKPQVGELLLELGLTAWESGQYEEAEALLGESLSVEAELGRKYYIASALAALAAVGIEAVMKGRTGEGGPMTAPPPDQLSLQVIYRSVTIASAAEALFMAIGAHLAPADRACYEKTVAAARNIVDKESWKVAWQEGQDLGVDR
jgi:hypothetical protein